MIPPREGHRDPLKQPADDQGIAVIDRGTARTKLGIRRALSQRALGGEIYRRIASRAGAAILPSSWFEPGGVRGQKDKVQRLKGARPVGRSIDVPENSEHFAAL